MGEQPVIEAMALDVPEWWRMVLVFAQILAYLTFAFLSVFAVFAKREWNRITKNIHDMRNAMMEVSLALRRVSTVVDGLGTRVGHIEQETKDNGKAIARVEGQLDRIVNGGKK